MAGLKDVLYQKCFVHKFPSDMPPGKLLCVTIGGVKKGLFDSGGSILKPFKKPKNERKVRSTLIEMEFDQKIIAQEVRVNLATAEISVFGRLDSNIFLYPQLLAPHKSTLTTYFDRKNGKKILHAYFCGPGQAFITIDRVLAKYDRVYCVDTNSAIGRNDSRISVTTAISMVPNRVGDHVVRADSGNTIELVAIDPPPGNPEVRGIWMMLAHLWKVHPHLLQGRLAIITDTELGKVKAWNDRTEPFFEGFPLPEGVDIFYASADAGSEEFLPNRLMRLCDALSTQKLRQMR